MSIAVVHISKIRNKAKQNVKKKRTLHLHAISKKISLKSYIYV